jgi:tripartite-type tricarboxylate transporter receptor subunit TctC
MKGLIALVASVLLSAAAWGQSYPNRAVRIIVPWPPGQAMEPASSTPEEMAAFLRKEQARYGLIIKNANIMVE